MRALSCFENIYLHKESVDFRKGINGLSQLVESDMGVSSMEGSYLFVFCNRGRDKLRILYWDKTGFALWHKQLEEDAFKWPQGKVSKALEISVQELEWLLEGVDITKIKTHREKSYKYVG